MIQESYKGHTITITIPRNKIGNQIVWSTVINSKQVYKVYADLDTFLDDIEAQQLTLEAIEDCKQKINMSEETQNTQSTEEIVTANTTQVMEDPAEANVCDSCQ